METFFDLCLLAVGVALLSDMEGLGVFLALILIIMGARVCRWCYTKMTGDSKSKKKGDKE